MTGSLRILTLFTLGILCFAEKAQSLTEQEERGTRGSAPLAPPSESKVDPAELAAEIAEIQQHLGGSLVKEFEFGKSSPQPLSEQGSERLAASYGILPDPPTDPVTELRSAAWQLDQAAHRLELVDLYEQADQLRQTAQSLRLEARARKAEKKSSSGNGD